jgi:hypothetical protein
LYATHVRLPYGSWFHQYTRPDDAPEQQKTEVEDEERDPDETPSDVQIAADDTVGKDSVEAPGGRVFKKDTEAITRGQRRPGVSRAAIGTVRAPGSFSDAQAFATGQQEARNTRFVQPETSSGEVPDTLKDSFSRKPQTGLPETDKLAKFGPVSAMAETPEDIQFEEEDASNVGPALLEDGYGTDVGEDDGDQTDIEDDDDGDDGQKDLKRAELQQLLDRCFKTFAQINE